MKLKLLSLLLSLILVLSCFGGVFSVSAEDSTESDDLADYDALAAEEGYVARIGDQETAYADGAFTGYYKFFTETQLGYAMAKKDDPTLISAHEQASKDGPETVIYLITDLTPEEYDYVIAIKAPMTIDGQGFSIIGNWNQKTIEILANNITLRDMTIWQQGQHGCIQQSAENINTYCEEVYFYTTGNVPYAAIIMNKGANGMYLDNCAVVMETDKYAAGDRAATAIRNHFTGGYLEMNNCIVDTSGAIGRTGIYVNGGAEAVLNNCTVVANAMAVSVWNGTVTINDGSYSSVSDRYYYKATVPSKGFFPPHPVLSVEVGGLYMNGSVVLSGANAPVLAGYEYYYQTKPNTTKGVQDIQYAPGTTSHTYLGADDTAAIAEGYVARVGLITEAIEKDDKGNITGYPGYYKTLAEAITAAEGETITLLADVDATDAANLTLGTATINGAGHTLTAKRIYKDPAAELVVSNLIIKTTTEAPILQMNEGDGYGEFINCTFETDQKVPYAYFVLQSDLYLDGCTINITNAECDKPIFRLDKGCSVIITSTTIDTHETAPNLTGFDVVSDLGSVIILDGTTHMYVGKYGITSSSKANAVFSISDDAIFQSVDNALVLSPNAKNWGLDICGNAQIISDTKVAIKLASEDADLYIEENAKIIGAREAISVTADNAIIMLESGTSIELAEHANNNAAILLEGANAMLISDASISAKGVAIKSTGADNTILVKSGEIKGSVELGTTDAPTDFAMLGGSVTAAADAAAAITVNNGSATILGGTLAGGAKAIAGEGALDYPAGETSILLNELEENLPEILGVSLRMNEGSLGMRFSSAISADVNAFAQGLLEAGIVANVSFGTLITRETEVRNNEMTIEALEAAGVVFAEVRAEAGYVPAADGSATYTAAIINFTEDNMGTAFTARAYIEYMLADGSVLRVYSEGRTEGISVGELAQIALADVSETREEGYKNITDSYYEVDEDGWYDIVVGTAYSPYSKEQREALLAFVEGADL